MSNLPSYVIMTYRAGQEKARGAFVGVVPDAVKRLAIEAAEAQYRKENKLKSSIALATRVLFEGTEEECNQFYDRLIQYTKGLDIIKENNG